MKQTDLGQRTERSKIISVASCKAYHSIILTNDGTQKVKLLLNASFDQSLHLYIRDVLGQLVQEEILEVKKGNGEYSINLKHELNGVYSLSLYAPAEKLAEKKILVSSN